MPLGLIDHLLLLAAVACAASLVRLLQRAEGIGRGYALLVGGELVFAVFCMGASRFWATVAVALIAATVIVPWLLEAVSRWAFARGHLVWVARSSSLRASLMPGSGLARQLPILDGLALLEREGVEAALVHFRRLADEVEDQVELALIHEQIISMLFHSHRWDEGIAYYERRFQTGYAALRPSLALGLLRAYGESGRLETAALLLRELEEGPVGRDPKTAELLGQARLTFLAYAGAVAPVEEVLQRERFVELGLTPATATLFKGIAEARAGVPQAAAETLAEVEALAGPRDGRVIEAAKSLLRSARSSSADASAGERDGGVDEGASTGASHARDDGEVEELPEELRAYVDVVAARLHEFLRATHPVHRRGRPLSTYAIIVGLACIYGVQLLRDGGGVGLLELGALSEDLWRAGAWNRVLTSAWLHTDLIGLLFDVYAIWLGGQIVERLLGRARMLLITVGSAVAGMAASVLALPLLWSQGWSALAVVVPAGGHLMALATSVAALWLLLPRFTPQLARRVRRNLGLTLALLLVANLLSTWPGLAGVQVAPAALLTAIAVASALALALPVALPRWGRVIQTGLAAGLLGLTGVSFALLVGAEPEAYLVDHRIQRCTVGPVVVHTPLGHVPVSSEREGPTALPVIDGLVDGLELRGGGLVQVGAWAGAADEGELALFEAIDGLDAELSVTASGRLPEPFAEVMADDEDGSWRSVDLWRNGERVGRVIERRLAAQAGRGAATVYLVAAPADAIEHGAWVHAAMMADAQLAGEANEAGARPKCTVE